MITAAEAATALTVRPQAHDFGACVTGLNLQDGPDIELTRALRELWLRYQVLYFPDQPLDHDALEQFTQAFGEYGNDPYVAPLDGHRHILEVKREPDEAIPPFGASWHSDWSFQTTPPSATILHAKIVPPMGGDTHFADGIRAYDELDPVLRDEIETLQAIHSARRPYSHEGFERSGGRERSMKILPSDKAWSTQLHPIVRTHPESGRRALWVNPVYTIGIADLSTREADDLLARLFRHALAPQFIYAHKWSANMLTMWDNRTVQHCAQGGYDGHRRVMHRTTVAGDQPH